MKFRFTRKLIFLCFRPPNTVPCLVQGLGRVGRFKRFGSKLAGSIVLYNEEDLKENIPGMTDAVRNLLRSSSCLKVQLAAYFGYKYKSREGWCCSSRECDFSGEDLGQVE